MATNTTYSLPTKTAMQLASNSAAIASQAQAVCTGTYNNNTIGVQWLTIEVGFTFAAAPTQGVIEFHAIYSPQGGGVYNDTTIGLFDHSNFIDSITPQAITTAQYRVVTRVEIAPHQLQIVVKNLTSAAINAGWYLNIYPYNMVNQ